MDVNGGTNYSHMGTNQMMSVPYALYAENANINYDSISTILSNDSTFVTSVSGGIGVGGCDIKFPEGYGDSVLSVYLEYYNPSYVVPTGKRLYITNSRGDISISGVGQILSWGNMAYGNSLSNPIILNSGEAIER